MHFFGCNLNTFTCYIKPLILSDAILENCAIEIVEMLSSQTLALWVYQNDSEVILRVLILSTIAVI